MDAVSGWAQRLTAELESVLLDTLGLAPTIEWHLHRWQKSTGITCELALNNVARHAKARRVAVALTITPHEVALVVRDNGIGLGQRTSSSSRGGIAGMRARAQSYKGRCEFAGVPNAGTIVTLSLPIPEAS